MVLSSDEQHGVGGGLRSLTAFLFTGRPSGAPFAVLHSGNA